MTMLFSADFHANHGNICLYCKRPQLRPEDVDLNGNWVSHTVAQERGAQMTRWLIDRWNQRVKPQDTVFHVGDFICRGNERGVPGGPTKAQQVLEQLNGNKVMILGNHDHNNGLERGLDWAIMTIAHKKAMLIHNPAHVDPMKADVLELDVIVCGHVHTAWQTQMFVTASGRRIPIVNVGVDVNKYAPVTLSELVGLIDKAISQNRKDTEDEKVH